MSSASYARRRGFTLMELMIVVAIVGLLTSVAVPTYQNYTRRTNRTVATQFLVDVANREQQYLMDARSYANTLTALNLTAPDQFNQFYTLTIAVNNAATPPTYLLTAAPISTTLQGSDVTLTLDNTGAKTPADKWK